MFDIWMTLGFYFPEAVQSDVPSDTSGITLTLPDLNVLWTEHNGRGEGFDWSGPWFNADRPIGVKP